MSDSQVEMPWLPWRLGPLGLRRPIKKGSELLISYGGYGSNDESTHPLLFRPARKRGAAASGTGTERPGWSWPYRSHWLMFSNKKRFGCWARMRSG